MPAVTIADTARTLGSSLASQAPDVARQLTDGAKSHDEDANAVAETEASLSPAQSEFTRAVRATEHVTTGSAGGVLNYSTGGNPDEASRARYDAARTRASRHLAGPLMTDALADAESALTSAASRAGNARSRLRDATSRLTALVEQARVLEECLSYG